MNKTKTKSPTGEGWAIHVYDSDRHLRLILEASHIWAFGWGIGIGLLIAIMWSALHSASHSLPTNTNHLENLAPTSETNPTKSLYPEPTNSFPFGID